MHQLDSRSMKDLTDDERLIKMAQGTIIAIEKALEILPPQQMVHVPNLIEALTADDTYKVELAVREIVRQTIHEQVGSSFLRLGSNPWTAEQALSRIQCVTRLEYQGLYVVRHSDKIYRQS